MAKRLLHRLAIGALLVAATPSLADLRGHGGPVRALVVAPDGERAISGGFDNSVIRWSLRAGAAVDVIRFHDGPVNAVALLPGGRAASAGEDGRIVIWGASPDTPERVLTGHEAKIVSLTSSPDGRHLIAASWDRTVRAFDVASGENRVLHRHQDNANAVALLPDGVTVVSAGYDAHLRFSRLDDTGTTRAVGVPTPLNVVAVAADGEIVSAGADGRLRFHGSDGAIRADVPALETPIVALALSPDGRLVAAAGLRGAVAILTRADRRKTFDLVGPRFPVWSLAFTADSRSLMTGGADRTIRIGGGP
jgi:cytochrome c